ncbi:MAG: DMT family transporter [Rhodospirillales bacterium]|jgi:drug/metabolite transporter (DMT)-like permease|nr:DMT family transporter [Rhodospirillales bacterium]
MTRLRANLLLLVTALIWGSTFTVQQLAMEHIGPMLYTGARFLLGALVVLPFAIWQMRKLSTEQDWRLDRGDLIGLAVTGSALFAGALLQQIGIKYTTVANAGFLTALYVPLTPIIALIALRQFPHWAVWPAAVGCTAGAYVLSGGDITAISAGDLWVIAGSLFWAIHVLMVGYMARRTRAPFVVATAQFAVCAIWGIAWGGATEPVSFEILRDAIPYTIYGGVFSVGIGFTLQVVAQQHTPSPDAAIILSSETVFAAMTGMVILGEVLSVAGYMGCAMILAGVLAVELLPIALPKRVLR